MSRQPLSRSSSLLRRGVLHSCWSLRAGTSSSPARGSATSAAGEPPREGCRSVITEIRGSIMTIGINRPEARNAINQETAQLLYRAFESFEEDISLTVAVLHGLGGNFCAGYDLKELARNPTSIKLEQDVRKGPGPMGPSRMRFSKPVIAAVSGYAVAGGLELSLLADLRVVEESAILGVFCRRFGVPLIDGGTVRLPKLIGLSRALDLILTGRPVSAQEAYQFGLANRIVPSGQETCLGSVVDRKLCSVFANQSSRVRFPGITSASPHVPVFKQSSQRALPHAIELAEQISAFPQQCMCGDRNSAYHSAFDASSFTEAMQFEFDTGSEVILNESIPGANKFFSGHGRGGAKL